MKRIVLILPCCIGDVVIATATLKALRRGYPDAHITWAVGGWSRAAVEHHDLLDAILDTGPAALPVRSPGGMLRFVRQLRAGQFDLLVSLVRSPLMSVAALLSGISTRVGLDSGGRGFGYSVRVPVDPNTPQHEGIIYLQTAQALGLDVRDCWANVPVYDAAVTAVRAHLRDHDVTPPYIVINPAGGRNPGMVMDAKRWPPPNFAALANRLRDRYGASLVLLGARDDQLLLDAVSQGLDRPAAQFAGTLTFGQIAALARDALVYIGNDTGLTHLAAAAGAKTAMILGPSDPQRYAPFVPGALPLWNPVDLPSGGVAGGGPVGWDWARDGISVDAAEAILLGYLHP